MEKIILYPVYISYTFQKEWTEFCGKESCLILISEPDKITNYPIITFQNCVLIEYTKGFFIKPFHKMRADDDTIKYLISDGFMLD